MSATPSYESGLRQHRIEYVRETTAGETPADPEWSLFSDVVRTIEPSVDAGAESQYSLGDPDSVGVFVGTEIDELTVAYDMQQKDSNGNILFDGSGNAIDAATDGLTRDSDNRVRNTHTIVLRQDHADLKAANTINGTNAYDSRRYLVVKGAFVDEVTLAGDPSDAQPVSVELTYQCEKIRSYQIDQPDSAGVLHAVSTSTDDSTQTVTVEGVDDTGTDTTEDISLDGTTAVVGTTSFAEIDAVELDGQTDGNVQVYLDDGGSQGDQVAEIKGSEAYDHGESDLGIPVTGSGAHASAIDQPFETYHDDVVQRPDGTELADGFETTEFSVVNNIDALEQGSTPRPAISAGIREVNLEVTVFGETAHHDFLVEQFTTTTQNVRWTLNSSGAYIQADSADPREVGASIEVEESKMMTDITFTGQGLSVSNN